MGVTLKEFVRQLSHSGLMSATEVEAFQRTLPVDRRPSDGDALAQELVDAHRLTPYQATAVFQGNIADLVFGEYRVLDKLG